MRSAGPGKGVVSQYQIPLSLLLTNPLSSAQLQEQGLQRKEEGEN